MPHRLPQPGSSRVRRSLALCALGLGSAAAQTPPGGEAEPVATPAERMEAPDPGARADSPQAIPESVSVPTGAAAAEGAAPTQTSAETVTEAEENEEPLEIRPAADTESLLPHHVGSPLPGQVSVVLGFEDLVPVGELRLALADWVRLDVQAQFDTLAPLFGTEVRFAAGGPRGGLWAHVFAGGGLRPVFDADVISGARLQGGLGLVFQSGPWVLGLGGGLVVGFSINPIDERERLSDLVDQTGGLFSLQRLEFAFDLLDFFQLGAVLTALLPLDTVNLDEGSNGVLPAAELRFGTRVAVRF